MRIKVKLDTPLPQLEQVRFEEQLKERGIEDKNGDGYIIADEIDLNRVPGGLAAVKFAAGADGLMQPAEVGGVNIQRGTIETVMDWLGFTKEKAATKSVQKATEEIREATEQLKAFRRFTNVHEFVSAVEELNEAGKALADKATRSAIGLSDKAVCFEMKAALIELRQSVDILNDLSMTPTDGQNIQMSLYFYEQLKELNSSLEILHSVATEIFGLSFPKIQLRTSL